MLITYYEDGRTIARRVPWPMLSLMIGNAFFASGIVFAWTYLALFVAEPLAWATWMPITRGYGLVGLLEYPFVTLWLLPLIGIFGSWLSLKGGHNVMAYAFVGVPLIMLCLVLGWFYLTPSEWH